MIKPINKKIKSLPKFDLQRFVEGWHYDLYKELGAIAFEDEQTKGYCFRVYAPNAKQVNLRLYLDESLSFPMQLIEHGIWEIKLINISKKTQYKFEIITKNNEYLHKTDPMALACELDPYFNSLTYDLDNYVWNDEQYLKQRQKFDLTKMPMAIYEVHLGSWQKTLENDFLNYRDLAHKLIDYVKKMHYTHIELMPICEHPFLGSWGYQLTGYFAPTIRYGKPEDLKYLIDYAHQNNIGVLLDVVLLHFNKDDHSLYNFDGTHETYSFANEFDRENVLWGTANFNLAKNEVKSFLLASLFYWINVFHVDGFRFDAVSYILYYQGNITNPINHDGVEFLKNTISHIKKLHSDVLIIAEDSSAFNKVTFPIEKGGLGFDLKWDLGFSNDLFKFMKLDFHSRKENENFNDITFSMTYNFNEHFILAYSHDEVVHLKKSLLLKSYGYIDQKFRSSKLMIGYMMLHPGKKLLFMGMDFAQYTEWSEKKSLDWHLLNQNEHQQHQLFTQTMLKLYREETALYQQEFHSNTFQWISVLKQNNIWVFARWGIEKNDCLICILNFSDTYYQFLQIPVINAKAFEEIINSDDLQFGGTGAINYYEPNKRVLEVHHLNGQYLVNMKVAPFAVIVLKPHWK